MKKFIYTLFIGLGLVLASTPVLAFDTPVENERGLAILKKMGTDLSSIAARFGCPDFAWANFIDGGRVAAFVYTPNGVDYKKSPRKVSVAIHALEGDAAKDKATLVDLAKNLQAGYKANGKVIKTENFHNAKDEPGFYIEYTLGEGAAKEHSAGVFLRLTSHTAAFIQLQSRGAPLSAEDSAKVKSLISMPASAVKKG